MNISPLKKFLFAFAAGVGSCIQFASEVHSAIGELQHDVPASECNHVHEYEHVDYDGDE